MKLDIFESIQILRRLSHYNVIVSASEKTAIPLAMLLSLTKRSIPHVVISHHLSSKNKNLLFRLWPLYKSFSEIICVSKAQAEFAVEELKIPPSKVHFIYDKVDHQFFRPMDEEPEDYILAVGQEQRDYKTLQKALAGTRIKLIIVASSHWSTYRLPIIGEKNTKIVKNIPYHELRSLYAKARLVVIPLNNVYYAAGANSILEAMAMGKLVIVTKTPGIKEYVVDGETGLFVNSLDPESLRGKILEVWDDKDTLTRIGSNARQAVEKQMNLPNYVEKISRIVEKVVQENK
ncbi:MAG: glycosyltransferase family 4 protein [Anaerolineae bacterium]|nr:glycosyltransferase family 4 protein [Anaerolineae bacterium]